MIIQFYDFSGPRQCKSRIGLELRPRLCWMFRSSLHELLRFQTRMAASKPTLGGSMLCDIHHVNFCFHEALYWRPYRTLRAVSLLTLDLGTQSLSISPMIPKNSVFSRIRSSLDPPISKNTVNSTTLKKRCTEIHFAKNQLCTSLISLSLLSQSHPKLLPQLRVRSSIAEIICSSTCSGLDRSSSGALRITNFSYFTKTNEYPFKGPVHK